LAPEDETVSSTEPTQTDRAEPIPAHPPEAAAADDKNTALCHNGCFRVSRISLIYRYLLLLALTVIGVILLALLFPMAVSGRDYLIAGLLAIWGLALLRYWVFLMSMPHRICLEGDDLLVLHSLFRTKKIGCGQIVAFRVSPFYPSYLRIVTSGKKTFPMLNHVDGLHELIARVKRVNPKLETRGC